MCTTGKKRTCLGLPTVDTSFRPGTEEAVPDRVDGCMVVGGWERFGGCGVSSSDCEALKLASESCYRLWTLAVVLVRGRCHRLRPCGHVSLYLVMYTAQMRGLRRMQPSGSRGRADERLQEGKAKYTKSVAVAEKCSFGKRRLRRHSIPLVILSTLSIYHLRNQSHIPQWQQSQNTDSSQTRRTSSSENYSYVQQPRSHIYCMLRYLLQTQYELKQYKKGLKVADTILKKFPNHGETLAIKALTLHSSLPDLPTASSVPKREEAEAMARLAVKKDITSHITWHVLGILAKNRKDWDEASRAFAMARRQDPVCTIT